MGNSFHVRSGYYGSYPAGYLDRIRALFPDKRRVLHLFSGKVDLKALAGDTVDINAELDMAWCLLILRIASRTLSDTRRA
jgi:hypothetical protein